MKKSINRNSLYAAVIAAKDFMLKAQLDGIKLEDLDATLDEYAKEMGWQERVWFLSTVFDMVYTVSDSGILYLDDWMPATSICMEVHAKEPITRTRYYLYVSDGYYVEDLNNDWEPHVRKYKITVR